MVFLACHLTPCCFALPIIYPVTNWNRHTQLDLEQHEVILEMCLWLKLLY